MPIGNSCFWLYYVLWQYSENVCTPKSADIVLKIEETEVEMGFTRSKADIHSNLFDHSTDHLQ